MHASPAGITVVNARGEIVFANARAEQILGLTRGEVEARTYNAPEWRITALDGSPFPDRELPFSRVKDSGQPVFDICHAIEWPDGRRVLLSIDGAPLLGRNGVIESATFVIQDITARNWAEQMLQASEERYRSFVENMPVAIYRNTPGPHGEFVMANRAYLDLFGFDSLETLRQSAVADLYAVPAERQQFSERLLAEDSVRDVELQLRRVDGSVLWGSVSAHVLRDENGQPRYFDCVLQDITERKRVENELAAGRSLMHTLLDNLPDYVYVKDAEGRLLLGNMALARLLGVDSPDKLVGRTETEYYGSELAEYYHKVDLDVIQQGRPLLNWEEETVDAAGNWLRILTSKVPLYDDEGRVLGVLGISRDVTERYRIEQALRESEAKFATAFRVSPDAINVNRLSDGLYLDINEGFTQLTGYTREEAVGKTSFELNIWAVPAEREGMVRQLQEQGYVQNFSATFRLKDGRLRTGLLSSRVIDWNGEPCILSITRDIHERAQAEARVHEMAKFPSENPEPVMRVSADGILLHANPASRSLLEKWGSSEGEPVPEVWRTHVQRVLASQRSIIIEEPCGDRIFALTLVPIVEMHWVNIYGHNITGLRQAQEAERDQRILAEALIDSTATLTNTLDVGLVMQRILDNVGRVVPHDTANIMLIEGDEVRLAYWRGYTPEQAEVFSHFRFNLTATETLYRMYSTGQPVIVPDQVAYSGWVPIPTVDHVMSYVSAPIRVHEQVVGFLSLDSTIRHFFTPAHAQRLQAFADQAGIAIQNAQLYGRIVAHKAELEQRVEQRTAELNQAKERVEAILNSSSDAIFLAGIDGAIQQTNPAFDWLFGSTIDAYFGQSLLMLVGPDHTGSLHAAFQSAIQQQQPQRIEVVACCRDEHTFNADLAIAPLVEHGQTLGVVCSMRDITAWKDLEAQLRRTLERQMELNELKTRFVSIASHELRNPLAVIQTASDILRKYSDRLDEARRQQEFVRIRSSIKAMVQLLDDVLTIGRVEAGKLKFEPERFDLIEFCQELVREQSIVTGLAQKIEFSASGATGDVIMDRQLLRHIISNLLSNAVKYSPSGSAVQFDLGCDGQQAVFRVADAGIGIPEADQANLYIMFHRAENVGQIPGTGLGLAIVRQAVELHGGTITFESTEGEGTTFTVTLPMLPLDFEG